MRSHNFKKQFGQNFLRTKKFAYKIIEPLEINPTESVIEIGPGDGLITETLIETGANIVAVEIDYDLLAKLIRKFEGKSNFKIIHADFLNLDLNSLNLQDQSVKVTGSLPFNFSKQIIQKLLLHSFQKESNFKITSMCFNVQEEVSKLYNAVAPDNKALSIVSSIFAKIKKLETIPAREFFPKPKINGAILKFELLDKPLLDDYEGFAKFVRIGFTSPNKKMIKNLLNSNKFDKDTLLAAFEKLSIKENARASELEHSVWIELFKLII